MLCGCANPPASRRATSTTPNVDVLRHTFDDARRLVVPSSPPLSPLRHCFSVRVRPSSATPGGPPAVETTLSQESLGLGAEAEVRSPSTTRRTRSYTLADGATSAIGRILTCFQQDTEANSDDAARSRPRSRSLWSRRRSPVTCLSASSTGVNSGGCVVDVVLDCSPGTVRRRRLETQSVASTDSDGAWHAVRLTAQDSEVSCESSDRLLQHHPVWEQRQPERGSTGRPPTGAQPLSTPIRDIPRPSTQHRPGGDSAPSRRRVVRRATTCAIPHPQVRVIQTARGGGGQQAKNDNYVVRTPTTPSRVS